MTQEPGENKLLPMYTAAFASCAAFFVIGTMISRVLSRVAVSEFALLSANLLPLQFSLLCGAVFPLIFFRDGTIAERFGFRGISRRDALPAISMIGVFLAVAGVSYLFKKVLTLFGTNLQEQPLVEFACKAGWGSFTLILVSGVILAPAAEELVFRHVVFNALCGGMDRLKVPAAICSAALFSLIHGIMLQSLSLFLVGLVLQLGYLRGGIARSILMHSAFNACSMACLLFVRMTGIGIPG